MLIDFENNRNKGYTFINYIYPLHILLFYERIWEKFESKKFSQLSRTKERNPKKIKGIRNLCLL